MLVKIVPPHTHISKGSACGVMGMQKARAVALSVKWQQEKYVSWELERMSERY